MIRLSVAGNIGSGKTTLARMLSKRLKFLHVPMKPYDTSYVHDVFGDSERWSFEAQVAFLMHKAMEIKRAELSGRSYVVDRSIYEEADVFARYFYEKGAMSERSWQTYETLKRQIYDDLPRPDVLVYIDAQADHCISNLVRRAKLIDSLYPEDHVRNLGKSYSKWIGSYQYSDVITVPDEEDRRAPQTADKLIESLANLVTRVGGTLQPSLFTPIHDDETAFPAKSAEMRHSTTSPLRIVEKARQPTVYIAAPFTGLDIDEPSVTGDTRLELFPSRQHGTLPGTYRKQLARIASLLKRDGFGVVLPHRDYNRWGEKELSPQTAASACIGGMFEADAALVIAGRSFGAHTELGVAIGRRIPTVVVRVTGFGDTFFAQGLRASGVVGEFRAASMGEFIHHLRDNGFERLLFEARLAAV